jgi:hypothetical protein
MKNSPLMPKKNIPFLTLTILTIIISILLIGPMLVSGAGSFVRSGGVTGTSFNFDNHTSNC